MTTTLSDQSDTASEASDLYRVSTLFTGFLRMWRGWKIVLPVLLANAILQALLVLPNVGAGFTPLFLFTVAISAAALVASGAVLTAACLDSVVGPVRWKTVSAQLRTNWLRFTVTIIALAVLVIIGLAIYTWPGLLVPAILPFLTLEAMAGRRNPIKVNFEVIATRPFRWVVTLLIIGAIALVMWVAFAVNGFFVPQAVGAFVACFVGGLLVWWWQTALALIYRSVNPRV